MKIGKKLSCFLFKAEMKIIRHFERGRALLCELWYLLERWLSERVKLNFSNKKTVLVDHMFKKQD